MFIKKLRLKNLKAVRDETIDFTDCNVITGRNFSGKSTLITAIAYGLTDFLEEKIIEYVTWGEKYFEIELDIQFDDSTDFNLYIKGGDGPTKKILSIGGDQFFNSDATKKLAEFIDPVLTLYSSIALQHETTNVIFDQPAPRLTKLKSILGMDSVVKASEILSNQIKDHRDKVLVLKTELATLQSLQFEKQSVPDAPDIDLIQKKVMNLEEDYRKFCEQSLQYKKEVSDILKQKSDYDAALRAYEVYCSTKLQLQEKLEIQRQDLSKQILKDVPVCYLSEEEYQAVRGELAQNQAAIIIAKNHLALAKDGRCDKCGQDFPSDPAVFEKTIKSLTDKNIALAGIISEYEKSQNLIHRIALENKSVSSRREVIGHNIQTLEKEIDRLSPVESPGTRTFNIPVEPVWDSSALNAAKKELIIAEQQIAEILRIEEYNLGIETRKQLTEETIRDKQLALDDESYHQKICEESRSLLDKEFSSYLLEEGLKSIEAGINDFFKRVHPAYQVYLKQDKKSLEFVYNSPLHPGIFSPVSLASGFERQLISMGFRIALTGLQDLEILVLDEVDSSAEDEYSLELYRNIIACGFKQIFVISQRKDTIDFLVNDCGAKKIVMGARV